MQALQSPEPRKVPALAATIDRVKGASTRFARLGIPDRIQLLRQMRQGYRAIAEESVLAACRAKGIDPDSSIAGEEWLSGPWIVIRNLRLLEGALQDVQQEGAPSIPRSWMSSLPDGRLSINVFPASALDSILLPKYSVEVHLSAGITEKNLRQHQASFYRTPHAGKLCVVLGAGNVNAIPPTDCAYKMFVEGKVCILKMNPVNAYLGPLLERAFSPAIEKGYLAIVYGGADEGSYLVNHPAVDEIHITGSEKTHDLLVWGAAGPERDARKRRGEPLLKKEITSELGNISPVIIVPGPYRQDELWFQARDIAGMVCNNASFNCNAAKLLVTARHWNQRAPMLELIEKGLARGSVRKAYYPGALERWTQFTAGRKDVRTIGTAGAGELPYALIPDVDSSRTQDPIFNQEPWCTILSETALTPEDPVSFLEDAVAFLNEHVWGTLCATLIVHPQSLRDPRINAAVEKAIRDLRYGTVALNAWPAAVFALGSPPWGGHPSDTLGDIQSGRGWVHNTLMLEAIEKCVLRAPLKGFPVAPWFPGHRSLPQLVRRLVDFEMAPSWLKVPAIAIAALRA